MNIRQAVRVEDHGGSGAPTSFREVAVDHILLATTDLGTASQALSDRLAFKPSRVAAIQTGDGELDRARR